MSPLWDVPTCVDTSFPSQPYRHVNTVSHGPTTGQDYFFGVHQQQDQRHDEVT